MAPALTPGALFFSVAGMDSLDRSASTSSDVPLPAAADRPSAAETIRGDDLLAWRRGLLRQGGTAMDLDWLLEMAGGLSWSRLQSVHLHPQRLVSLAVPLATIEPLWTRHLQTAEPLQYIVRLCPWRDLELEVGPGVLIPRQETELLVDLAVSLVPAKAEHRAPLVWLDLGCGSGCLAVALARAYPGSSGWAVDCSEIALTRTEANLRRHGCQGNVRLQHSQWWQSLEVLRGALDLIVTNPPYIPSALLGQLEPVVREHEPWLALDGGGDGLDSIRLIVAEAKSYLAPGGVLLMEHHHDQSEAVIDLLVAAGFQQPQAHRDLEGTWRFASARRDVFPEPSVPGVP
jgi:release factor glutamine methyltransferase